MTPKTLRQERIERFGKIIQESKIWKLANESIPVDVTNVLCDDLGALAEKLADAAPARTERNEQDETTKILFGGDWREYPEHLWKYAECLRDRWKFVLPEKPQKKSEKSKYSMFVMAMEEIRQNCGEFGVTALEVTHDKWRAAFKDGIAPYTVAQPTSLINVVSATAREMREGIGEKTQSPEREAGKGFYA